MTTPPVRRQTATLAFEGGAGITGLPEAEGPGSPTTLSQVTTLIAERVNAALGAIQAGGDPAESMDAINKLIEGLKTSLQADADQDKQELLGKIATVNSRITTTLAQTNDTISGLATKEELEQEIEQLQSLIEAAEKADSGSSGSGAAAAGMTPVQLEEFQQYQKLTDASQGRIDALEASSVRAAQLSQVLTARDDAIAKLTADRWVSFLFPHKEKQDGILSIAGDALDEGGYRYVITHPFNTRKIILDAKVNGTDEKAVLDYSDAADLGIHVFFPEEIPDDSYLIVMTAAPPEGVIDELRASDQALVNLAKPADTAAKGGNE